MSVNSDDRPIFIPKVESMRLRSFSLYEDRPNNDLVFGDGVFCLVGANGLGKSTFLSALGFAITGIVAESSQKFASIPEYYADSIKTSKDYFTGRISQRDRYAAEVSLSFLVNGRTFEITRGFFEPTELRYFAIDGEQFGAELSLDSDEDRATLHEVYTQEFVAATGFASFAQYAFVHHFLLTFDERRELLFWNPDVARQAIYLSFGVDADEAQNADEWLRQSDRLESQARQAQYQATTALQRIKELTRRSDGLEPLDPELVDRHATLVDAEDRAREVVERQRRIADDARLSYALAAAEHHALVRDYDRMFNAAFSEGIDPTHHPLVRELLDSGHCGVCGNQSVADRVKAAADSGHCPLCDTALRTELRSEEPIAGLEALDGRILTALQALRDAEAFSRRTDEQMSKAEGELKSATEERIHLEAEYSDLAISSTTKDGSVKQIIEQLEAERRGAQDRRDKFRVRRDSVRAKLEPVQQRAAARYLAAAPIFVPRFQKLAHSFLGLDLQVTMEQKARGVELVLTINGTRRRRTSQLSESQRYFVDVALRMALVEYMVKDSGRALLIVDTPEGSLDISYETRAGKMFSAFVTAGNQLIMTANINSSNLVRQLATEAGKDFMRIERMLDWAPLSEVQADSEQLFDDSFTLLNEALTGRDTGH